MKKLLLTIFALVVFCQTKAQFFEGFEGTTMPDPATGQWALSSGNWLISDNGVGLNQHWTVNSTIATPPLIYAGMNAAYINRENIGMGNTSEDWLVTPAVTIPANGALTFYTRSTISGDQSTYYQVLVSTTSQTDHSSFTPIAIWTESELNAVFNFYEQKGVSLSAYSGQTIYIAFVKSFLQPDAALGGDRWLIDNVTVGESLPPDVLPVNTINGSVSYNYNGNGCDGNGVNAITIAANSGTYVFYKSAYNGTYSMTVVGSDFTVSPHNYPNIFAPTPQSHILNFPGAGSTETADFCFVPNGTLIHDVSVDILPYGNAPRPGFDCSYKIIVTNLGHSPESGTVNFSFDDSVLDFVSATPTGTATAGVVTLDFTDLYTFQTREYIVTLNLNSPMETPPVNIGHPLTSIATVSIPGDSIAENNTAKLEQIATGSWDPNDKTVNEGATITPDQTGEFLHYTIRFQNTGTAAADFVRITDDLSNNLDLNTLEIISWSHDVRLSLQGNRAEFLFDSINLPPTIDDEPGSHGYVAYKIKPMASVGLGDAISNTANIFFDYNFPITTNTVTTTVTALGTGDVNTVTFNLYPNPAAQSVTISLQENMAVETIAIFNLLGQKVKSVAPRFENNVMTIDVADLNTGTYFIQLTSDKGKTTRKLVKS